MLGLVEGLPLDSITVAMRRAKSSESYHEYVGWDREVQVLADLFDAVQENTRATGMYKKTPPPFPPYAGRPKPPKKKATVKDLFNRFQQGGAHIHGG